MFTPEHVYDTKFDLSELTRFITLDLLSTLNKTNRTQMIKMVCR